MSQQITLSIADFSIQLNSDFDFELEDGYLPFITNKEVEKPNTTLECFKGIPSNMVPNIGLVFEAKNEIQKFYSIYKTESELLFIIYNQQSTNKIQQLAILNEYSDSWKVYMQADENDKLLPLKYPLGPIIMQYLTVKSDAVMIHASCAFDGKKGRIFTGFSGAGKSTISKIWADANNLIINDDRLIIRKQNGNYYVHNTPMYYIDKPKKAPLNSIYLISHSPINKIKKMVGAMSVSKVLAFCIQNNFESAYIQNNLNFLSDLSQNVSVFELGFVPDKNVVNFILENETTGA